jgi:argininosuccinate synthase
VTGEVTLRLRQGAVQVAGRSSEHALYDERFVTFGEDDVYQQSDAAGFIRLFALPSRVRALKNQEAAARHNAARGEQNGAKAQSAVADEVEVGL